jgi:hypothetical protein
VSLAGLGNLTRITRWALEIRDNDALATLDGLEKFVHIERHLEISDNPVLASIDALGGLDRVGETIIISNNTSLDAGAVQRVVDSLVAGGFEGEITVQGNK